MRFSWNSGNDVADDVEESEIGELDSDDDKGDFECHDAEFFDEEVDEHDQIGRGDEEHDNDDVDDQGWKMSGSTGSGAARKFSRVILYRKF